MRALVLFGSASDEPVVSPLMASLEKAGLSPRLEYVSAHRNPQKLDEILKTVPHDVIVAGAGLAAHLPGVVASKVSAPVIGVPVDVVFMGLDALMSIVQMPPGIPVLTAPMPNPKTSAKIWTELMRRFLSVRHESPKVILVGDKKIAMGELTKKARAILDRAGVQWSLEKQPLKGAVNIVLCPEARMPRGFKAPNDALLICVPTYNVTKLKQAGTAVAMSKNIEKAKPRGLWVGANNFVNAVCGSLQMFNSDGKHTALLSQVKKGEFRG